MAHRKRVARLEENILALLDIKKQVNEAELDHVCVLIDSLQKRYNGLTDRYVVDLREVEER